MDAALTRSPVSVLVTHAFVLMNPVHGDGEPDLLALGTLRDAPLVGERVDDQEPAATRDAPARADVRSRLPIVEIGPDRRTHVRTSGVEVGEQVEADRANHGRPRVAVGHGDGDRTTHDAELDLDLRARVQHGVRDQFRDCEGQLVHDPVDGPPMARSRDKAPGLAGRLRGRLQA